MSRWFLTRVELYGSDNSGADYAALHRQMEARNFHRIVQSNDGAYYHLPTAEYYSHSETLDANGVRELAAAAARAIGFMPWPSSHSHRTFGIIVAETPNMSWQGLRAA